jgi:hypothetical protein
MQIHVLNAGSVSEIDDVFAKLRADALIIIADPFFDSRMEQLSGLAIRYRSCMRSCWSISTRIPRMKQ